MHKKFNYEVGQEISFREINNVEGFNFPDDEGIVTKVNENGTATVHLSKNDIDVVVE